MTTLLSSRGRSDLGAVALTHPVRTLLLGYALSRLGVLAALWIAASWFQNPAGVGRVQPELTDLFGLWDGIWYRRIAEQAYPIPLPLDQATGLPTYSAWAFYPAFPFLIWPLTQIGIPFVAAGVILNLVLGAGGALLVWHTLRHGTHAELQPARERLALVAAVMWCLYPATTVLLQPYSEALAAVLVLTALVLVMERRYGWLSIVALALGLTRGVAPALAIVIAFHVYARWREDRAAGLRPLDGERAAIAGALVATGISAVLWPGIAALATRRPTAFFDVQAAWGQRPADGPFVLWFNWAWNARGVASVAVLVGVVATYLALVLGRHGRWVPIEVRAWAVAYPVYLVAVVRPITSMWRFLILDVPIAAFVTSAAMRTSTGASVVPHWRRRVAVVLAALCIGVVWWTCTLWVYTPWGSRPP